MVLRIAGGAGLTYNVAWIKLDGERGFRVEWERVEEEAGCPYHSGGVEIPVSITGIHGIRLEAKVSALPWQSVSSVLERISKLLRGRWSIRGSRRRVGGDASLAWLSRMGEGLVAEPLEEGGG